MVNNESEELLERTRQALASDESQRHLVGDDQGAATLAMLWDSA
jgi:hypothetical protein